MNNLSLINAITILKKNITKNPAIAEAEAIKVSAKGGTLEMTSTNFDHSVTAYIPNCVESDMEPFLFYDHETLLKALSKTGNCELLKDGNTLLISEGKKTFTFATQDLCNFPETPIMTNPSQVTNFDGLDRLKNCKPYMSKDDLRPAMCGVYFHYKDESLAIVATDAHSLICSANESEPIKSFIMPSDIVNLLISVKTEKIVLHSDESRYTMITFISDGTQYRIMCKNVDATFPDYTCVIPTDNPIEAEYNTKALIESVKAATQFANKQTGQIAFILNGTSRIESKDLDFNRSYEEMIDCKYNDEITISFASKYLLQALALQKETTTFQMSYPNRAAILRNGEEMILLMPIISRY